MLNWSEWLGYTYGKNDFNLKEARENYEKYLRGGVLNAKRDF